MISSMAPLCAKPYWIPEADTSAVQDHEVTIVTAFVDIGRGEWSMGARPSKFRRSVDHYFDCFSRLANISNRLVIYIQSELADRVLSLRKNAGLADRTIVFAIDNLFTYEPLKSLETAISTRTNKGLRRRVVNPAAPEYNEPRYVLVNFLKASFVVAAINSRAIKTQQVAWIDFGYCREKCFPDNFLWRFDTSEKINIFHIRPIDEAPIYDICLKGEVYIQGGHIVGHRDSWANYEEEINISLNSLMDCDLVDDDQTLMLMAYRRNPMKYVLNPVDPKDWFVVFKNFNLDTNAPQVFFPTKNSFKKFFFRSPLGRKMTDALGRLIERYWQYS